MRGGGPLISRENTTSIPPRRKKDDRQPEHD
jgi:hypothetical protein